MNDYDDEADRLFDLVLAAVAACYPVTDAGDRRHFTVECRNGDRIGIEVDS